MFNDRQIQSVRNKNYSQFLKALVVFVILAAPASASDVQKVTFSGGSGETTGGSTQVWLTVGQGVVGKTSPIAGQVGGELGIWYMLRGTYIATAVDEVPQAKNQLMRNYPNPFNPSTTINYTLAQTAEVRLDVYDLKGLRVGTLLQGRQEAGQHSLTYQPKNLASGTYFVSMRTGNFRATQRIMLVK